MTILNANASGPVRRHGTWLLGRVVADADDEDWTAAVDVLLAALESPDDVIASVAMSALVDVGGQDVARRVGAFAERTSSEDAADRAERVLERIDADLRTPSKASVVEGVEFTYVEKPAD
ncbi:MAG: hypothetical protein ACOCYX_06055, partial [Spirochaetota bacterium]